MKLTKDNLESILHIAKNIKSLDKKQLKTFLENIENIEMPYTFREELMSFISSQLKFTPEIHYIELDETAKAALEAEKKMVEEAARNNVRLRRKNVKPKGIPSTARSLF